MNIFVRFDNWTINQAEKVVEFLNDWLSLNRFRICVILFLGYTTFSIILDTERHAWFALSLEPLIFIWFVGITYTQPAMEFRYTFWVWIRYLYIVSIIIDSFGFHYIGQIEHREALRIIEIMQGLCLYLWSIFVATGGSGKGGNKLAKFKEKVINLFGNLVPTAVPEYG